MSGQYILVYCTGEAEYINDINPEFGELFGAFVLSTIAQGDLLEIDASEAEVCLISILLT